MTSWFRQHGYALAHALVHLRKAPGSFLINILVVAIALALPFTGVTLLDNVREIRADHNPKLQVKGIVVKQFQARAKLPQRMVDELIAEGLPVLQPYLSSSVRIRESHEQSLPMIYLDPQHKLTQAFVALHAALG